jgi:hypothetical protein
MDKREFIKSMALLAAGIAASPMQVEAFERYYTANTPDAPAGRLIAVDAVTIGGLASKSMPAHFNFYTADRIVLPFGINLFGGVIFWKATADEKIITTKSNFNWNISTASYMQPYHFISSISYIDDALVRHTYEITTMRGSLEQGGNNAV